MRSPIAAVAEPASEPGRRERPTVFRDEEGKARRSDEDGGKVGMHRNSHRLFGLLRRGQVDDITIGRALDMLLS